MAHEFPELFPSPPPSAEIFGTHQLTFEFRRETEYRQEQKAYCQWYYEAVRQHQEEFEQMRGDINIFGWFLRGKR
ncbi:MAG: hypothetical protein ACOC04_02545 [Halothece sp.]